jgi:hypothetical protein
VRKIKTIRNGLLLIGLVPLLAGCAGASMSDVFQSDLLSKDANWFSKPGRVFIRNVSIETPPLSPDKPVSPQDLVSADGMCPGLNAPADANAQGGAVAPVGNGVVALGHTECDVVRGAGVPENVSLSANERGDRVAVLTYTRGGRPGVYTFTAGRLSMVERAPEPVAPARTKRRANR